MPVKRSLVVVAAAILFWGWETRMSPFALPMAGAVLGAAVWRKRLAFTAKEFARLWDMTLAVTLGAAIYNRQTQAVSGAVIAFLQWLPIISFPFAAAFFFGSVSRVPRSTFLFWWRGREAAGERTVDPTFPYFGLCLLAASASSARDAWFYPGAVLLIGAALAVERPARLRTALPVILFTVAAGGGYLLQAKWRSFQSELENSAMRWFAGFFPKPFEDQEAHTSLGEVGKLKSSGRVVMRVRAEKGDWAGLLRQASFDQYRRGMWLSTRRQYGPVTEMAEDAWELAEHAAATNAVRITASAPGGNLLLPLPSGAAWVRRLDALRLERNRFGNVRVWGAGDPMECVVSYNPDVSFEGPPQNKDLGIHFPDEPALAKVVEELGLKEVTAKAALERVEKFFSEFRYRPFVEEPAPGPSGHEKLVASFLTESREGHCEHFATAGVLLLRKAGIPARYALGYAAVEDGGSGEFQIRERHAHAWVLAWVEGRWQDFDPTPRAWSAAELRQSSIARPLTDRWADFRFQFGLWQPLSAWDARIPLYVVCPLALILSLLLMRRRGRVRVRNHRPALAKAYAWPGLDSEFFILEGSLGQRGLGRNADETMAAWLMRLMRREASVRQLAPALRLHYQYRFDPEGVDDDERRRLAESVRAWLERNAPVKGG